MLLMLTGDSAFFCLQKSCLSLPPNYCPFGFLLHQSQPCIFTQCTKPHNTRPSATPVPLELMLPLASLVTNICLQSHLWVEAYNRLRKKSQTKKWTLALSDRLCPVHRALHRACPVCILDELHCSNAKSALFAGTNPTWPFCVVCLCIARFNLLKFY